MISFPPDHLAVMKSCWKRAERFAGWGDVTGHSLEPAFRNHSHQLIAIDDLALLVDQHDAVRIAVKRDPDISAHFTNLFDESFRRGGAALVVYIAAIGIDADLDDFRAQFPQCFWGDFVAGPVGTIDHDAQAVQP